MITDNSIDEFEAQYWCMFSDRFFRNLINNLKNPNKAQAKLNAEVDDAIENSKKNLLEAKFKNDEGKGLQQRIDKIAGKITPKQKQELKMLYKKDKAAFQQHPLVQKRSIAYQKIAQANNKKDGVICDMDDNGNIVPMTMDDAEKNTTLRGFFSNLGKNFTDNLGNILNNVLTGAAIAGISYLLFKSLPYISQKVKYMYKKFSKGDSLAECIFTTADGKSYCFFYDFSINKWVLAYASMTIMSQKSFLSRDEVDSFLNTQFCKRFIDKCKYYIEPVIDNTNNIADIMTDKNVIKDNKVRKMIADIVSKASAIKANMFNAKIRYQD